ncbi:hypothetical protein U0035_03455 [Niabella yanshanensis]|uniref:Lipoprotein n=1 Tax=Niabella yanshanensis TaxID=577386 RepID=A0ABZ0WB59_9BACT|nr:hypothetical protein [Niabella yanshanensis]WQD39205.1 hypothetical protein U0035_03455 [Niabella yanshanensis]
MSNYFFITLLFPGCSHYRPDKVKIYNNTNRQICYSTVAYNSKHSLITLSAGGYISSLETGSPVRRVPSSSQLVQKTRDSSLYLLFYDCSNKANVYSDLSAALKDPITLKRKFSKSQLDSLGWFIVFNDAAPSR